MTETLATNGYGNLSAMGALAASQPHLRGSATVNNQPLAIRLAALPQRDDGRRSILVVALKQQDVALWDVRYYLFSEPVAEVLDLPELNGGKLEHEQQVPTLKESQLRGCVTQYLHGAFGVKPPKRVRRSKRAKQSPELSAEFAERCRRLLQQPA